MAELRLPPICTSVGNFEAQRTVMNMPGYDVRILDHPGVELPSGTGFPPAPWRKSWPGKRA
jgi:hypothetical protein